MIRAVLFDFDGTIADTIPAITEGVNLTMKEFGYPAYTEKDVRKFINFGPRNLTASALKPYTTDDAVIDRVHAEYTRLYGTTYRHTTEAYEGIPELIARLHARGIRIGVLSNKENEFVHVLSDTVLLPGTVDAVQGCEIGKPTKPDPYLSRKIADDLGVAPEECVMIGDSDVDIRTARNAGMELVSVSWGYRDEAFLRENGAKHLARTPAELEEILNGMIG